MRGVLGRFTDSTVSGIPRLYLEGMSASVIKEETRAVEVEHGCFYFGNWPQDGDSNPLNIEEPPVSIASYAPTGIGFFSECGDEDNIARVLLRFLDRRPDTELPNQTVYGKFVITSDELAVTMLMMDPAPPMESPYKGSVEARVHRLPSVQQPPWVEMEGDTHPVSEDWVVEIWPSST